MRLKNGPIEGETWVTSKVRDIYSNTSFDFPETPANCSNERKQMDPFPNAVDKLKGLNVKNPIENQGGRSCANARAALAEKFGLGRKV